MESLDALLDAGGANESHPLAGLAAMVGELVAAREREHVPIPEAMTAVEALAFFMARDGLRQAKSLAARFGMPMELFIA